MSQLFGRSFTLQVGELLLFSENDPDTGTPLPMLSIDFKVERSLNREPNKAEITIRNLSKDSQAKVVEKGLPVILEAGYTDTVAEIFNGDLRFGETKREGTDWITRIEAGDGSKQTREARINKSFQTGTPVTDALKTAAESLGVGLGNLQEKIDEGGNVQGLTEFINGVVLSGKSADVIDELVTGLGYEWSIQSGQIQILRPDEANAEEALLLSPSSGLVGVPETGEDGRIKLKALLDSRAAPGRKIQLESERVQGLIRVEKTVFEGQTWGTPWYANVEGKPIT